MQNPYEPPLAEPDPELPPQTSIGRQILFRVAALLLGTLAAFGGALLLILVGTALFYFWPDLFAGLI